MAIDILRENVSIHQTLGDEPNTDNGLSADDLKARFDRGAEIIRDYINETVVHAVNDAANKSETAEAAAAESKSIAESANQKAADALQKAGTAEGAAASAAQIASNASSYANSANDKAQQAMVAASDAKQVADIALASAEGSTNRAYEALRIANDVAQEMKDYSPSGTRSIAEAAMRMADQRIIAPEQAAVGQYFRVKEIDENGKITAVEAVDAPAGGGSGLTTAEKTLILSLFKNAVYTADMSATFAQLESLWSGSGEGGGEDSGGDSGGTEPDEPVVTAYKVTNNLTSVTNSNGATTASEFYSATLTADDGYTMSSVVITMGGVDVTESVYTADTGTILITALTGDIVITAVANQVQTISYVSSESGMTFYTADGTETTGAGYFAVKKAMVLQARAGADSAYKIRVTNNTDADISATIRYGDMTGTNVALRGTVYLYNAVKAKENATIAAGSSIVIDATVHGGYYPVVATDGATLDFEFIGAIPEMVYDNTNSMTIVSDGVKGNRYSADGSDGDSASVQYGLCVNYGDIVVSEDTEVEIVITNDTDSEIEIGYLSTCSLDSSYTSGEVNMYYNIKHHDNTRILPGVGIVLNYTIKAGYKLGLCGELYSGCSVHYREV